MYHTISKAQINGQ